MHVNKEQVFCGFLLLSINVALCRAETPPAPAPASPAPAADSGTTNGAGAKIQFATPIYDFGRIKSGEAVKYTYYFTNTGDTTLKITHVQPSCGCTTAGEYSKEVEP